MPPGLMARSNGDIIFIKDKGNYFRITKLRKAIRNSMFLTK